jgi:phenylpyruvate tautomerase PptA (4-oxalocrotonate tautomerase family)
LPKLDLTIPAESLTEDARQELARELGATLLRWEGAPNTEFFRSITWAHVRALPADEIQTPDGAAEPHAVVDITVPSGALSERRVLDATGWGEDAGVRVWILIHEVPDGNWGAAGQVVRFEQLREAAKAEREQEGSGKEQVPAAATKKEIPA